MKVAFGLLAALISTAAAPGCRKQPAAPAGGVAASSAARESAPAATPPAPPPPATPPQTAEACRGCRGEWKMHGISDKESCVCRTTDGGKTCRDSAECQGPCIAASDNPARDVVEPGPPPRGYFVGRCSDVTPVFGCNRIIERGAAKGPGPLDEPPQMMCAD